MFCATGSGKKVSCCISCKIVSAIFCSQYFPFNFSFFSNAIVQLFFRQSQIKRVSIHFYFLKLVDPAESLKNVLVRLEHSNFSVLEYEEPNNDLVSALNLCLRQNYFIQLIVDAIQTLGHFCVESPMCLLIAQYFFDSVATTINNLIAVGAIGKQFHCFRKNT